MSQIKKSYTEDRYEIIFPVLEEHDGLRLDQFLLKHFESFSRQFLKKKISKEEAFIVGRPHKAKPSTKVYKGESVSFSTKNEGHEDEYWNGERIKLTTEPEIIFENDGLVVINKPPFMSTHPAGKHLFNCATVALEKKYGHTIHSIHRLDRETSGVLVLGKNPKDTNIITSEFENRAVQKCYFFVAHKGQKGPSSKTFTANERLGLVDGFIPRNFTHCFPPEDTRGKSAQTLFEILMEDENFCVGLAFPKTGRQHQIRAHAYHHSIPLVGDKLYNQDPIIFTRFKDEVASEEDFDKMLMQRHALHAISIRFPRQETLPLITAPLPEDIIEFIETKTQIKIKELSRILYKNVSSKIKNE